VAAAQEMIGLDDQRKGFRQHGRIDDFDPRPTIRDVANQAIDAATRAKGQVPCLNTRCLWSIRFSIIVVLRKPVVTDSI
jgi:hypothetical protein